MGTGTAARTRRVIYQDTFARRQHDNRAINTMLARAEKITTGATPVSLKKLVQTL